jgi:chromosome segregation ATPase
MDETSLATLSSTEHPPTDRGERRRQARELLSTQNQRLDRLEGEISQQLQCIADEIARELSTAQGEQAGTGTDAAQDARVASLAQQVDRTRQELAERQESLDRATSELSQARDAAARSEQELRVREALLADAERRDERQRSELSAAAEQLTESQTQLALAREREEEARRAAAAEVDRLAAQHQRAKRHRLRAAKEFKARHSAQAAQIEELGNEIARLRELVAQGEAEQNRLLGELREAASPQGADPEELHNLRRERESLAQRLAAAHEQLAEREQSGGDLEKARLDAARLEQELRVRDALVAEGHARQEKLQVEAVAVARQLADAQARLAAASERLNEFDRMAALVEQSRIELGRMEQEMRVRESQLADAQAREDRHRAELSAAVEQLRETQVQLASTRERQDEMRCQLGELAGRDAEIARLGEVAAAEQAERERLAVELRTLTDRVAAEAAEAESLRRERDQLAQKSASLETRLAEASRAAADLEQARIESARLEQELRVRESVFAETRSQTEKARSELASTMAQLGDLQRQFSTAQSQLAVAAERAAEADRTATQLEQARLEAARVDRELRIRDTLLAEAQAQAEKRRAELAGTVEQLKDAQAQLAAARERQESLRRQVDSAQQSESTAHESQTAALREALERAETENARLAEQARRATETRVDASTEVTALRSERDRLAGKLAEAQAQLDERPADSTDKDRDDLTRRFEMAVEELREQKRITAELEARLKKAGSGSAASAAVGGAMDWESQKKRWLASLEEDERDDEEAVAERQSIEGTIRITDQIVEQKDREIADLKRLLEEKPDSGSGTAAAATATAELLDSDETIRLEREKLREAQAEWREKIGKAEIDISVERAKIARERMELEEKLRLYQNEQAARPSDGTPAAPEKPARGRWLSRLGLKDLDDE